MMSVMLGKAINSFFLDQIAKPANTTLYLLGTTDDFFTPMAVYWRFKFVFKLPQEAAIRHFEMSH